MNSIINNIRVILTIIFFAVTSMIYAKGENGQSNKNELSEEGTSYSSSEDTRRKIRLGFTAPSTMHRQLLLTEDENATSGIDWGYDSEYYETGYEDAYWMIDNQKFTIQGIDSFDNSIDFPLGFHIYNEGMCTIRLDGLENISDDFNVYLFDKELNTSINLREDNYEFYASEGEYIDRFEIVFNNDDSLSSEDHKKEYLQVHYSNTNESIILVNPSLKNVKSIELYNINGQSVFRTSVNEIMDYKEFKVSYLSTGAYVIKLKTTHGEMSKKVLVHN